MIILGVLVLIGGIFCIARPGMTFLSLVWFIGIMMFVYALQAIMTYSTRKKLGLANGWSLFAAILACICGIAIIVSGYAELVAAEMLLYMLFGWLIATGILTLFGAFGLKSLPEPAERMVEIITGRWWIHLIFGILLIAAGIFGFVHPLVGAFTVGMIVGIEIIISGINMIATAFAS
jgi:uncharacterized membrane protein HdeD (DUF308 family)